jgi:nicotinate-nucleotide adenylyltransferase
MRRSSPSHFGTLSAAPPLVGKGQKIGLLGGTFNPPHAAHVLISEVALKRLQLDHLWWLVTPGNPLKRGSQSMSLEDRAAACRNMVTDPRIVVTTFEKDLPSTYTASTLDFLRLRRPEAAFVWVMGADCLAQFHRWHRWRHIFSTMPIAVIDRPGWRLAATASPAAHAFDRHRVPESKAAELAKCAPPAWTFLTGPLSPLSSTQLRRTRLKPAS